MILCLSSLALTRANAQWTQTTSLPDGYAGQALGYWSGFLYQAGGGSNSKGILDGNNVFYAQVHSNGTLGTWNVATPLPEATMYHAGVVANGFDYVLGGIILLPDYTIGITNAVYYARINPDGNLGAWQTANPLPHPLFFLSAATWNGRIYVAGGYDGTSYFNAVWSAQIQTDGSLSPWVAQAPLPDAVFTQAEVANGMLYVLGGMVNGGTTIKNKAYYSRINADGTLAGWNQTTPLPQPLGSLCAVPAGGRIFVTGGDNGSRLVANFYSAAVAGDGSLATWSSGPALPRAMYEFGMAVTDSYIFLAGGTDNIQDFSGVYSMPLLPPPTAPALAAQSFGTNGAFQLQLTSSTNTGFGLQASTNLADWTCISWGFTDTNGLLFFQDTNAAQFPRRFYRAYWPLP